MGHWESGPRGAVVEMRIRAVVEGRVQGVGFRYFTQGAALDLGLQGYVRNLDDGRVEVVATGPAKPVTALLRRLEQGPPNSRVDSCQVEENPGAEPFAMFSIRH